MFGPRTFTGLEGIHPERTQIMHTLPTITHADVDAYLTLEGSWRAYVRVLYEYGITVDVWASFRSTAIRKLIDSLIKQ